MRKWMFFALGIIMLAASSLLLTRVRHYIKAVFYIDHMEREERIARMHVDRIVNDLDIRPGEIIADIGAGSGLFSRKIALKAGTGGTVYAVDINEKLLNHINARKRVEGSAPIVTVRAEEMDPKLPARADLIFICDTLHYVADPAAYVKVMSLYLKPGGRIAVIDFYRNHPQGSKIFTEAHLTAWMKSVGMEPVSRQSYVADEYYVIYKK